MSWRRGQAYSQDLRERVFLARMQGLQRQPLISVPYSADLNSIEQVFAKLKALLRATALRSVNVLSAAVRSIVRCVLAGILQLHPTCRLFPVIVKSL